MGPQCVKPWGNQQHVLHLQGAEHGLTFVPLMALPNFQSIDTLVLATNERGRKISHLAVVSGCRWRQQQLVRSLGRAAAAAGISKAGLFLLGFDRLRRARDKRLHRTSTTALSGKFLSKSV